MQMGLRFFLGDRADHTDQLGLLGVGAMGEIQARNIHAGAHEVT